MTAPPIEKDLKDHALRIWQEALEVYKQENATSAGAVDTDTLSAAAEVVARYLQDMLHDRAFFEKLLSELLSEHREGKRVIWMTCGRLAGEEGIEGTFTPSDGDRPHIIEIFRSWQRYPNFPLFELCSLAHEYGHYRSYLGKNWPDGYPRARDMVMEKPSELIESQKRIVMEEEVRAWKFGWSWLKTNGFQKRKAYRERMLEALNIYCDKLKLGPECWTRWKFDTELD